MANEYPIRDDRTPLRSGAFRISADDIAPVESGADADAAKRAFPFTDSTTPARTPAAPIVSPDELEEQGYTEWLDEQIDEWYEDDWAAESDAEFTRPVVGTVSPTPVLAEADEPTVAREDEARSAPATTVDSEAVESARIGECDDCGASIGRRPHRGWMRVEGSKICSDCARERRERAPRRARPRTTRGHEGVCSVCAGEVAEWDRVVTSGNRLTHARCHRPPTKPEDGRRTYRPSRNGSSKKSSAAAPVVRSGSGESLSCIDCEAPILESESYHWTPAGPLHDNDPDFANVCYGDRDTCDRAPVTTDDAAGSTTASHASKSPTSHGSKPSLPTRTSSRDEGRRTYRPSRKGSSTKSRNRSANLPDPLTVAVSRTSGKALSCIECGESILVDEGYHWTPAGALHNGPGVGHVAYGVTGTCDRADLLARTGALPERRTLTSRAPKLSEAGPCAECGNVILKDDNFHWTPAGPIHDDNESGAVVAYGTTGTCPYHAAS